MSGTRHRLDVAAFLSAVEAAPPMSAAGVMGEHLEEALGASGVSLLVADLGGRALVRLADDDASAERVPIAGTPPGRALLHQEVQVEETGAGTGVYAPVTTRGDAIGVLELHLPHGPDDETAAEVALAARALAYVVIANRRFTDYFEWGQRARPLTLGAEIQRRLLPAAYTFEAGPATVAGWLQPASENAGDTFDFSLDRDTLHLSLTDAMGHKTDAALLATAVVGALRNARREGVDLEEQVDGASRALHDCVRGHGFATGQVARIDLRSGAGRIVNAGHPPPWLVRGGEVSRVELAADPPLGAIADWSYRPQPLELRPGDRLYFVTDGVLERRASALDVGAVLLETVGHHARDAVQELMHALIEVVGDDLEDDATAMCLDWHGAGP